MLNTYPISEVAAKIGAPSERWVIDQIRAGRFPARKIGRTWRMTDQDVADALDACRNVNRERVDNPNPPGGLTPTSRRRLAQKALRSVGGPLMPTVHQVRL